jgi:hypothetical protein
MVFLLLRRGGGGAQGRQKIQGADDADHPACGVRDQYAVDVLLVHQARQLADPRGGAGGDDPGAHVPAGVVGRQGVQVGDLPLAKVVGELLRVEGVGRALIEEANEVCTGQYADAMAPRVGDGGAADAGLHQEMGRGAQRHFPGNGDDPPCHQVLGR